MDLQKTLIKIKELENKGLENLKLGITYIKEEGIPTFVAFAKNMATKFNRLSGTEIAKVKSLFQEHVHFNFKHFVGTTATAAVVFALTFTVTGFSRVKVNAEVLAKPTEATAYNNKVVSVNYGDDSAILDMVKDIVADENETVYGVKPITVEPTKSTYEIGNFIVDINKPQARELKETQIEVKVEPKEVYATDLQGIEVASDKDTDLKNANVARTYTFDVDMVDTQAPTIALTTTHVDVLDTDNFDPKEYVARVYDNYDETVNYTVTGSIDANDEDLYIDGDYTFTYTAVDTHGNKTESKLVATVTEDEEAAEARREAELEEERQAAIASGDYNRASEIAQSAPSYAGGSAIASAALAQLGVAQDCTALASNALAAVGIYFHGWPAEYMSLGTIVSASEAQPGDLIYYDNAGAGVPHIAVYIGNGQAVHGGYMGSTVIASAYMGSGPVFIRIG
ncbi:MULTISPECIES: NlpC/P60 family protein [unclassified Breznakia]|uniref:NlpC/P60 family protein n=1 Tax=unclassified Breznakia TaxID=2623764 RepID=UPI002476C140|nr:MULTISPECIES: NlpC/P60 family protein [unclassified Breznakia]MDH6367012.1 cell wall-associated NlpC family hydrolase [Breznakia sp. PH1-1]MDH6404216.1 cell wall-associated NlpC family hydrolase [Breznakia sp. PF1-11]MDH6411899.1 cell wall-associated NlpC family hydrolase [Breznakia sp. PFB1-11]MDH6414204.1 cell wall-associated NlpC family hydrolase [Breznakia sp. PFB1-14]MDH6415972.1 cell wall-associated NlpC family hydrolase [Breznakia sp. PFB1-4]